MTIRRKYDLGNGVTIEDDGKWLHASHKKDDKTSTHVGCYRPLTKYPETFKVVVSLDEKLYYLLDFTDMDGIWLSFEKYDTVEAVKGQGSEYVQIVPKHDKPYYRKAYSFRFYNIKNATGFRDLPFECDEVKDYLAVHLNKEKEQAVRFNEVIAPSGRDLDWLIKKIGPWVPVESIPVIRLED